MIRVLQTPVAAAVAVTLLAAAGPAAQSTVREEQIALDARGGSVTATLMVPSGKRPAMVLIVGGSDIASRALAESLAHDGIASVRGQTPVRKDTNPADDAAWIVQLRNDPRWSSITVAAYGDHVLTGRLAARAARADAFVSIGMSDPPPQTFPVTALADDATTAAALTTFVRALKPPRHPEGERRSPRTLLMTEAAGCRIAVEYGRLSKRGRAIWGALVPFDKWWTPGADETPTLTTSETLVFGDLTVPAGDYTLYTIPGADRFSLIINRETGVYHTTYREDRDLGRIPMTMTPVTTMVEQLTFGVTPSSDGGTLTLAWDDREYSAPFVVRTTDR